MPAPGQAVPGTVVAPGALTSPGGASGTTGVVGPLGPVGPVGPTGPPAVTTTSADFTVPNIGATTTVTVLDASWVVLGQMVYVANAGGGTSAGALQVTAKAGNLLTLLNPATISAIPPASSTTPGLMNVLSGLSTDYVGGDNACHVLSVGPVRSYNAIGNPTFEVDQRRVGSAISLGPGVNQSNYMDRWNASSGGTMTYTVQQIPANVLLPGTNFFITSKICRFTLTTAQASLGASDFASFQSIVEGQALRELLGDVTSVSLLVRSSVANVKFGLSFWDSPGNYGLVKLCTCGAANTWTLIQFPNLPIWTPSGTFPVTPGSYGYSLQIVLAAGSNQMFPANDVWVATPKYGAVGQSNFSANAVNSTFDIAFVQHEPGPVCNPLIDKPFNQNYDECLRYYQKSYEYSTAIGNTTGGNMIFGVISASNLSYIIGLPNFLKPLAKTVTPTVYNANTGAVNSVYNSSSGASATTGTVYAGQKGLSLINLATNQVAGNLMSFGYTADTGW
jgi:hypothetical protein